MRIAEACPSGSPDSNRIFTSTTPTGSCPRRRLGATSIPSSGGHVKPSRFRRRVMLLAVVVLGAVAAGVAFGAGGDDRTGAIQQQIKGGRAKNVIFFLGDGMGDSEITIARNYALGAAGRFAGIDALPLTGESTTWSLQESDPSKPNYVTDSAAAGTAWATGHKTSNGRVSTSAASDQDLKTILEIAKERGFATGNVSTAEITDATPAVLDSHVAARGCQGPLDMSACCRTESRLADSARSPSKRSTTASTSSSVAARAVRPGDPGRGAACWRDRPADGNRPGYRAVTDRSGLFAAQPGKKLLGLFNSGNMTLEWSGALATPYPGTGPQRCNESNRATTAASEPTLAEMTRKAIDLLDQADVRGKGKKAGFFLQVEGASIDKQDHAQNPCGQIGETVAFDRAIQVGLDFARTHPDTLIIVTADHAHTSQIVEAPQTATHHSPGAISDAHDGRWHRHGRQLRDEHLRAVAGPHRLGGPRRRARPAGRQRRRRRRRGLTSSTSWPARSAPSRKIGSRSSSGATGKRRAPLRRSPARSGDRADRVVRSELVAQRLADLADGAARAERLAHRRRAGSPSPRRSRARAPSAAAAPSALRSARTRAVRSSWRRSAAGSMPVQLDPLVLRPRRTR